MTDAGKQARWKQVLSTSGARIYVLVVQLLSTAVTARFLGAEGRGLLVAAVAWVSAFAMLGYLSMAQPVFYRVNGKDPREWLPETVGTLLCIVAVVTVVGWAVAALLFRATGGGVYEDLAPAVLMVAFAALPFMLWQENGNSILLAMGRLDVLNRIQVAAGTVSLALVVLLAGPLQLGVRGALWGVAANPLLIGVLGVGFMLRQMGEHRPIARWDVAKQLLAGGAKLHLNSVGGVLAGQVGILIINSYVTPGETAYYHLAGQMLMGLQIVPGAMSSVAYTLIAQHGPDGAWPQQRRLVVQSILLSTGTAGIAYFLAPLAVDLLAGREFRGAVPLFRILLLTVLGSALAGATISQWVARGLFVSLTAYGLAVGLFTVAGLYAVIPRYGLYGAAWLAVATSAFSVAVNGGIVLWIENRWKRTLRYVA